VSFALSSGRNANHSRGQERITAPPCCLVLYVWDCGLAIGSPLVEAVSRLVRLLNSFMSPQRHRTRRASIVIPRGKDSKSLEKGLQLIER
jgi:hypothetical protein